MNNLFLKSAFLILAGIFSPFIGRSQTGPGGVGSTDGSSALKLWLRADDLNGDGDNGNNPGTGTAVSVWGDFSGNNNEYTSSGSNRPTYYTSGSFDAVRFDASQSAAQFMSSGSTGTFTPGSAFFAMNPIQSGNSNSLFDNSFFSLRVNQWHNTARVGYTRYGVADYTTGLSSPFGINSIISFHKPTSNRNLHIRINGNESFLNIRSNTAGIPFDRIGRNSSGADEASGDFYEVILFDELMNGAQQIIIDNYLSAKYGGIALNIDVYDQDEPGNGNYDFEVAGIGRINGNNMHTDARGTGILRVLNPSNLNNNEFLMWGHDNGTMQFNMSSGVPSGVQFRLGRTWRASEVNTTGAARDVGRIDMRFDMTGLGNFTVNELKLIVDTDNDGLFEDETPIDASSIVSGTSHVFEFESITAITDNVRFTLGLIELCPVEGCVPMSISLVAK